MSLYKAMSRTDTHPHGQLVTRPNSPLAFVRISKCGSSSFSNTFQLNQWMPFDDAKKNEKDIYCALRDPVNRFMSSVPETIKRFANYSLYPNTVLVSNDVYHDLAKVDLDTPFKAVSGLVEAIKKHGYFDAHHEPMCNFLFEANGESVIDPKLFQLEKMNEVINRIRQSERYEDLGVKEIINSNMRATERARLSCFSKDVLGKIDGRFVKQKIHNLIFRHRLFTIYPIDHPISRHVRGEIHGNFCLVENRKLDKFLSELYSSIRVCKVTNELVRQFTESQFEADISLFESVKRHSEYVEHVPLSVAVTSI